jgi:hypothetical protein
VSDAPDTSTQASAPVDGGSSDSFLESSAATVDARVDERPELAVGAAFGGGLLLALILKRLAS